MARSRVVTVSRRMSDLLAWSKSHEGKKIIRYTLSSVITTGVSLAAILITYGFKIIPGIIEATLFGNVIAVIPSYYLNRAWAWGKRGKSHFRNEVIPYWGMAYPRHRVLARGCDVHQAPRAHPPLGPPRQYRARGRGERVEFRDLLGAEDARLQPDFSHRPTARHRCAPRRRGAVRQTSRESW